MGARVIPDGSGGVVKWRVTGTGQRPHILSVHLAPWTATTGAYVGSYTNGDTDVYDSAGVMFAQLKTIFKTTQTLTCIGFFPTVSGVVAPLSNVDPALSPETISGAGTSSAAVELGSQVTFSYHDDGGNVSKLVWLDVAADSWNPETVYNVIPQTAPGDTRTAIANIMTGFVSAGVFHTTPYMSHAGGTVTTPITVASTLNHRLRRDYGLI